MTSCPFSFNFQIDHDDTETAVTTTTTTTLDLPLDTTTTTTTTTATTATRIPFQWIDTDHVTALLMERSQEEIIYTDIPLTTGSSSDDVDHKSIHKQVLSSSSSSSKLSTTTTDHDDRMKSMRCVDLHESSYYSSVAGVETNSSNNNNNNISIVPGIYEGGRQVWECSWDLVQYLVDHHITLWHPLASDSDNNDNDDAMDGNERKLPESIDTHDDNYRDDEASVSARPRPLYALELGCGHALPGCYVLQQSLLSLRRRRRQQQHNHQSMTNQDDDHQNQNATDFTVVFTDYNESVLLDATLSNIVLNTVATTTTNTTATITTTNITDNDEDDQHHATIAIAHAANYILIGGGDWMGMSQQIQQQQQQQQQAADAVTTEPIPTVPNRRRLPADGYFDMILAAETIYTTSAAHDTVVLLQRHLRPGSGVAYIATKRYYFGVGGGVDVFRDFCRTVSTSNDPPQPPHQLTVETVKVIDHGTGNIREVLRVQSRQATSSM